MNRYLAEVTLGNGDIAFDDEGAPVEPYEIDASDLVVALGAAIENLKTRIANAEERGRAEGLSVFVTTIPDSIPPLVVTLFPG